MRGLRVARKNLTRALTPTLSRRTGRGSRRHGLSLPELVIATAVSAVLAGGLASTIFISQKAIPDGTGLSAKSVSAGRVMDQLNADLQFAQSVTTLNPREVIFTLADQDGKSPTTETVRYFWSGTPGTSLTREFNGNSVVVASSVQEFQLDYDKASKALPLGTTTSGEVLLASTDGITSTNRFTVQTANWVAQYVVPLLASNVTGWRVTKVRIMAKDSGGATGITAVQLQSANSSLQPTGTVLDSTNLYENTLTGSYTQQNILYSSCPTLAPTSGMCVVLKLNANSPSGDFQYWTPASPPVNFTYSITANSGATWTTNATRRLRMYVYGTVDTPGGSPTYQYALTNVRCALRLGTDTRSRINAGIPICNQPIVPGP